MNEQDERDIEAFYAEGSAFSRLYESAGRGICPPELEEELRFLKQAKKNPRIVVERRIGLLLGESQPEPGEVLY